METTAVTDAPIPGTDRGQAREIPSQETAKASHEMLEVLRNMNSTIANRLDAILAVQKTARETNRVVDPALDPHGDLADARSISDITSDVADTQLKRDICGHSDALLVEWIARNHHARKNNLPPVPHEACTNWTKYARLLKRANVWTGGAGVGSEWKPTGMSTISLDLFRLDAVVPNLFPRVEIPQGVGALTQPQFTTAAAVRVVSSAGGATTAVPAYGGTVNVNMPTSAQYTLTPVKHGTDPLALGNEMIEDSAAAVIPALVAECQSAMQHGWESGIINGQATTNDANRDSTGGPVPANGYSNGLRWYTIYSTGGASPNVLDLSGGAFNLAAASNAWAKLSNFGLNPSVLAWILPATMFYSIATDSQVRAVDYAGPIATLPRGTLAVLYGIPITATQNIPGCGTNGKVGGTGSPNSTVGLLVNTSRFRVGMKRSVEVVIFDYPGTDSTGIACFARHCFAWLKPDTDKHSVAIINTPA